MGRGRAKAKQTKVARELKYRNYDTDFNELARELHGENHEPAPDTESDDDEDSHADLYDDTESASR